MERVKQHQILLTLVATAYRNRENVIVSIELRSTPKRKSFSE